MHALLIVLIVSVTLFGLLGLMLDSFRGLTGREDRGYGEEEAKVMQDLHRLAVRLEARIEVLETVLFERTARERAEQEDTRHG